MNRPAVVHHGQRALAMLHRFPRCPFLIDSRRHDRWIGIHNIPDLRVGRRDRDEPANMLRRGLTGSKPKRKTSHEIFDTTLQKTQVWMNDLMAELGWENQPHKAYMVLRTVLQALRDRLTVEEAVQLGAQLPMLIRGFYYEGWTLKGKPHKERRKEDFLDHIREAFSDDVTIQPQHACRAVFRVLVRHTSAGEIDDVKHALPRSLRSFGPNAATGRAQLDYQSGTKLESLFTVALD